MNKKSTIIGSGIYCLDSIKVREYPEGPSKQRVFEDKLVSEEIGGTCGNVMCMTSYLGWDVYPEVSFDETKEGKQLTDDLLRYGCHLDFVSNTPTGGTTLMQILHKKTADGEHKLTCRAVSPGSIFPRRHFLRRRDEVPVFLEKLSFVPDVYFYDDPAAGHRAIAESLRQKGTLVYFEPNHIKESKDFACVKVSDVIKFSGQNIPDTSFVDGYNDKLFIQTLGGDGVRFKLLDNEWFSLPAFPVENVVDWEGAGDWTTSAFLTALSKRGLLSLDKMTVENVSECLVEAQKVASKSVQYMSSKGMINSTK